MRDGIIQFIRLALDKQSLAQLEKDAATTSQQVSRAMTSAFSAGGTETQRAAGV